MARWIRVAMWLRLGCLGLMVLDTALPVPWTQHCTCLSGQPEPQFSRTAWQLFQQREDVMFWVGGGLVLLGVLWRLEIWERSLRWLRLLMPLLSGFVAGTMFLSAALLDLFGPCFFRSEGNRSLAGMVLIEVLTVGTLVLSALSFVLRGVELWQRRRNPPVARTTS